MKIDSEETKYIKIDVSENSKGVEKMVAKQCEKEKKGRFYLANRICNTYIWVRNGHNVQERIRRFNERLENKEIRNMQL